MKTTKEKRYSPLRQPGWRQGTNSPSKKNEQKLLANKYFCHYSNAVYMGGSDSFKKSGPGILLLDDGTCVLCNHSHDNMVGHNVVFRKNSMTSMIIDLNKSQSICYRVGSYLLQFYLSGKDDLEGHGYFIDYHLRKLFKLSFRKSRVEKKLKVLDEQTLQRIFQSQDITNIIDPRHARALDFDFDLGPDIKHVTNDKDHAFGFCEKGRAIRGGIQPNGLAFRLQVDDINPALFTLNLGERGYYSNSYMHQFGERVFESGNFYIGGFNQGLFQGHGVLYDEAAKKWTYGVYQNGELVQVISSSIKSKRTLSQIIKQLHKQSKNYIMGKIIIKPSQQFLSSLLEEVLRKDPYEHESIDHSLAQKKKHDNLKRIQTDYTQGHYQYKTQEAILDLVDKKQPKVKVAPRKQQHFEQNTDYRNEKRKSCFQQNQFEHSNQLKRSKTKSNKKLKIVTDQNDTKEGKISSPHQLISGYFDSDSPNLPKQQTPNRTKYAKASSPRKTGYNYQQNYEVSSPVRPSVKPIISSYLNYSPERLNPDSHYRNTQTFLARTYFPEEQYFAEAERSRSRQSEGSARKRVHQRHYKYIDDEKQQDDQLHKKILHNRFYRQSPSRY